MWIDDDPERPTYTDLRAECLAWKARAAQLTAQVERLESVNRQLQIQANTIAELNRFLAIENVKLLNKPDPERLREYAKDTVLFAG